MSSDEFDDTSDLANQTSGSVEFVDEIPPPQHQSLISGLLTRTLSFTRNLGTRSIFSPPTSEGEEEEIVEEEEEIVEEEDEMATQNIAAMATALKDIQKLNKVNYNTWRERILACYEIGGLLIDFDKNYAELSTEDKSISARALAHLKNAIDDDNLRLITLNKCTNTNDAWKLLKDSHLKKNLVVMLDAFENVMFKKYDRATPMKEHLMMFKNTFNDMERIDQAQSDLAKVAFLMASLGPEFATFKQMLCQLDIANLKFDDVERQLELFSANLERDSNSSAPASSAMHAAHQNFSGNRNYAPLPAKLRMIAQNPGFMRRAPNAFNPNYNQGNYFNRGGNHSSRGGPSRGAPVDYSRGRGFGFTQSYGANRNHLGHQKFNAGQGRNPQIKGHQAEYHHNDEEPRTYEESNGLTWPGDEQALMADYDTHCYPESYQYAASGNFDHDNGYFDNNVALSANVELFSVKKKHRRGKRRRSRAAFNTEPESTDVSFVTAESGDEILQINVPEQDYEAELNKMSQIYTFFANFSADIDPSVKWILDSGATIHMCHDKNMFSEIELSAKALGRVSIANGLQIPIEGTGTVKLECGKDENRFSLTLYNVAFVPNLRVNLISAQRLAENLGDINLNSNRCCITINRRQIPFATFNGSSYEVDINCIGENNFYANLCIHDYHRMLSHRNLDDIRRQNLQFKRCKCSNECEACIRGKATRKPFPKFSEKPKNTLDVVVSDLCGPMNCASPNKSLYFMTFIDVRSGYTEVAFLQHKSQAKECIIQYIEKLKTSLDQKPKVFRSDSGGEYMDLQLLNYLKNQGIFTQNTVHHSSSQNGIAERANRTLMDAVRTMLIASNLPPTLWAEALNNAVYNFNRLRGDNEKSSPIEMFFNRPCKNDFHQFGEKVFVTLNSQGKRKLDPRATEMYYLGVDHKAKGYRLWNGNSVRVERDVRFLRDKQMSLKTDDTDITDSNKLQSVLRRSERIKNQSNAVVLEHNKIPSTYKQAMNSVDKDMWMKAMLEEMGAIERNSTWSLVDAPKDRNVIGCRWVFSIKKDAAGEPIRYKARLVAQGFTQVWGEDFNEVYAPVARSSSFRILLSLAGMRNYFIRQFDVTTAFLNGSLKEEIFMKQPPGFENGESVCKLNKSLYGLKQAAKEWNDKLNKTLLSIGFSRSNEDPCLYAYREGENVCYLIVHVDDFMFAATTNQLIDLLARKIGNSFELKDCGEVKHFLGIDIYRESNGIYAINQEKYINQMARELKLENIKPHYYPLDPGYHQIEDENFLENNHEYRKVIGMLIYVATNSRPDIAASVGILSQRVSKPRKTDLNEAFRVVKYLITSKQLKLRLSCRKEGVVAYSDADYAGDRTDYKSRSGFTCFVNGGIVEWMSRKQTAIASSSTEAEYYALHETAKEAVYLKKILKDFGIDTKTAVKIFCDSQSALSMLHGEKFSRSTKHMAVRFHYLKDLIEREIIAVSYVPTSDNISDLLTKPLPRQTIEKFRKELGLF